MPKRDDIRSVLVIGSGPIIIGQACEFDYSGTQACRVLKSEGLRVILVNSNPATIMTDPEFADATYVEPITAEYVEKVIEKERPAATVTVKERGGLLGTEKTTKKIETNGDGCTTKTVHHDDLAGSKTVRKTDCD